MDIIDGDDNIKDGNDDIKDGNNEIEDGDGNTKTTITTMAMMMMAAMATAGTMMTMIAQGRCKIGTAHENRAAWLCSFFSFLKLHLMYYT